MSEPIPGGLLLDPVVLEDPYPFYRRLREAAPVWRVPGTEIFVVSSYALLDEASRRVDDFSSNLQALVYRTHKGLPARIRRDRGVPQVLATADPPVHGIHKKAVFPELSPKRMAAMAVEIEQVADACLAPLIEQRSGEFMGMVANLVPITVVSKLVGFKQPDLDKLLQAAFDSTAIVGATLSKFQLLLRMIRSFLIFRWISRQLRDTSAAGDDILASVKRSLEQGVLRPLEGAAVLHLLLAAGGESTTSLLGNAVRILAEDRAMQDRLRAQPDLIPAFLEEVLRVESPFRHHLRSVPRDTALGGVAIPAGATVLLFWAAGNRDPAVFADPDTIDLTRPRAHMTFGRGIHMCLGAPLARLEGQIVLRKLLASTSSFMLDSDHPPRWVASLQVRRHEHLHIKLEPSAT
jgi:cytochrome P450 family 144